MNLANITFGVGLGALILALIAAIAALPTYLFSLLWNALAPVFHLPHLTFIQAWILLVILGIIGFVLCRK